MKKTRLIFSFVVLAAVAVLFMGIIGCEKDGKTDTGSDLDAYFAANPYLSDPRTESAEKSGGLTMDPESATATAIGEKINFTVSGGDSQYSWDVSTKSAGSIARQENTRFAIYTVKTLANNSVIAYDADGRCAIASISGNAGALTITPAGSTFESPYTYDQSTNLVLALTHAQLWGSIEGKTIQFTVSGGNPPYSWVASSAAQGAITSSGLYTVATPITIIGGNTVSVTDGAGDIASVTVTLKWKP